MPLIIKPGIGGKKTMRRYISGFLKKVLPETRYYTWVRNRIDNEYQKQIAGVRRRHDLDKLDEIRSEFSYKLQEIDEILEVIHTKRLRSKAYHLNVPIPPLPSSIDKMEDENWQRGHIRGGWYLKQESSSKLESLILVRNKERREGLLLWITVIGAFTGLVAVLATVFGK